jgi:hypothetical protein
MMGLALDRIQGAYAFDSLTRELRRGCGPQKS